MLADSNYTPLLISKHKTLLKFELKKAFALYISAPKL
jgi:hypothetical protein